MLVENCTELLVAVEHVPLPDGIFALAAKPIILADAAVLDSKHAQSDGWDVAKQNVTEDVVPPALAEVRQNVLHRKLNNLIKQLPEVQDVEVTDDQAGKEPVAKVHDVVVVEVVNDVLPFKFTVVVVGVHILRHRLVKVWVQVAQEGATLVWPEVEHKYEPAHVDDG